ncbi:MAG TPA: PEP/pyruvate-binding domain-containing protein, partial [Myxococcota bacterium]|nr:PEP/pyruvate-binding domain-containing protein [Myxococcota bacterium]
MRILSARPEPMGAPESRPLPGPPAVPALAPPQPASGAPPPRLLPDDARTESLRRRDLYGNKTANLADVEGQLADLGLDFRVRVPPFQALSHGQVRRHLEAKCAPKLQILEARLRAAAPRGATTLSPEAREALAALRSLVHSTLVRHPIKLRHPLFGKGEHRLMVRSTAREDSEDLPNPGGNASPPNVTDSPADVADAIATVVASYFSERSILQRLLEGDDIAAPPFMPVLLQVMIGETPGNIPTSGVMFTQEPEGPTPVTQIQATFGHNEAVVASLLPCDTFYVGPAGVRSVVRRKPERLVPNTPGAEPPLVPVDNPASERMRPCLSDEVLGRLHRLGQALAARAGGKPLDIEFVYSPKDDTLYILQRRPLVIPAKVDPTHLDPVATRDLPKITGAMVGTAGGQVRRVDGPDKLILSPDLAQALQRYLTHPRQDSIQAIVVADHAEPTCHEATTFRAARKPVMVVPDLDAARAFVDTHHPLALDAAMGHLVALSPLAASGEATTLQDLERRGILCRGWGKHPLPARLTAPSGSLEPGRVAGLVHDLLADMGQGSGARPENPADLPPLLARLGAALGATTKPEA